MSDGKIEDYNNINIILILTGTDPIKEALHDYTSSRPGLGQNLLAPDIMMGLKFEDVGSKNQVHFLPVIIYNKVASILLVGISLCRTFGNCVCSTCSWCFSYLNFMIPYRFRMYAHNNFLLDMHLIFRKLPVMMALLQNMYEVNFPLADSY